MSVFGLVVFSSSFQNSIFKFQCHAECVFNETGLFANNVIQHDKIVEVTKDLFKDTTEFMPVIDAAMKKCKGVGRFLIFQILLVNPTFNWRF